MAPSSPTASSTASEAGPSGCLEGATARGRRHRRNRGLHHEFAELNRNWIAARRAVVLEERDAGNLNEEVMRELFFALDAEELAFDSRTAVRSDARGELT